jgi:hypothetical protein
LSAILAASIRSILVFIRGSSTPSILYCCRRNGKPRQVLSRICVLASKLVSSFFHLFGSFDIASQVYLCLVSDRDTSNSSIDGRAIPLSSNSRICCRSSREHTARRRPDSPM